MPGVVLWEIPDPACRGPDVVVSAVDQRTTETPSEPSRLHVVLHEPEIAYNTGSVGRTCVAAGAKLWLVRPLGFQIDDRRLRRAGLDYWQHLRWETVQDWPALCEQLPAARRWYFSKKAARAYTDVVFQPGDALIFGSESRGLPAALLDLDPDRCLRIPHRPEVRSLNLSNSVAVAVYECLRQWDAK